MASAPAEYASVIVTRLGMAGWLGRLVLASIVVAVLAAAPATARADFSAGAATADITPPPFDANQDARLFPNCPAPAFDGPRRFAFQEPYKDLPTLPDPNHPPDPNNPPAPNGRYDYPEPFCDANGNGRYDDIFISGVVNLPVRTVHDQIDARAIAVSDGARTAVVVSVVAQGLFNNYIDRMIARANALLAERHHAAIDSMIVSANHNESSPDTVGIYGGPSGDVAPAGGRSGVNDYYMNFLVEQVAQAAAQAAMRLEPASLWADQFGLPDPVGIKLSNNWPTTDNAGAPAAIDPKVGLLQARAPDGRTIFTVMSLPAHNQKIGQQPGRAELGSDWPGYFHRDLEARVGGTAMFLVGDNGSQEDPCTIDHPLCGPHEADGSYARAQATGVAFAAEVAARAPAAQRLRAGPLAYRHAEPCVPLENNIFRAAAGAGEFGQRQGYTDPNCTAAPPPPGSTGPTVSGTPAYLRTNVGTLDVGPDLQLIANPGESFPALMIGGPWRQDDVPAECRGRPNPGVPTWRSHSLFRFQVGLANDMIGYEIPAWAYIAGAGQLATTDPQCQSSQSSKNPLGGDDSKGHHHKLESEGLGPSASNQVADGLTALVTNAGADPSAKIGPGRFVKADGSYTQFPRDAVAILLPEQGRPSLDPNAGMLVGAPTVAGFGGRAVDANALFMDYDGQPQASADVTTRGMMLFDPQGCVSARYYLDEFPSLDESHPLPAMQTQRGTSPELRCTGPGRAGVPGVQNNVATAVERLLAAAGLGRGAGAGDLRGCSKVGSSPRSVISRRGRGRRRRARGGRRPGALIVRGGRLRVRGTARNPNCRRPLARVTVSISRKKPHQGCRFVGPDGRLTTPRSCRRPLLLLARGTTAWSLRLSMHVPRGRYRLVVRAVDAAGSIERARHRRANVVRLRVR